MSDWRTKRLEEVCSVIKRGIGPKYTEEASGIPVINQRCIRDQKVSFENARLNDISKKKIPEDRFLQDFDVLINSTGVGTLGRVAQITDLDGKATVDSHVTIVRLAAKCIDPYFFGMALRYRQDIFERLGEGSTGQTELSRHRVGEVEISFPEGIPEQKAIAHILGTLDDKIELNRKMNQTLEAMAQALFKSWFVDFDPVLDNALAAGKEIPEALKAKAEKRQLVPDDQKLLHNNPELAKLFPSSFTYNETLEKWLPEGWEVKSIGEISSVISKGTTPRKSDIEGLDEVIPFIKVRDIDDNGNLSHDLDLIPYEVHKKQLKRSILEEDDLLFSIAGTIGRVAIVPTRLRNSNCNQAVAFIRLYNKNQHNKLVHQFLCSDIIQGEIHSKVVQAVQANTSLKNLSDLKVIIPNNKILNVFNSIMNGYYDRLSNNKEHSETLTQLRDTLLPQLISGKVRVPLDTVNM